MSDGYTKSEGYAASLRQLAQWVREADDPNIPASQQIGIEDVDADELEAAADHIAALAKALEQIADPLLLDVEGSGLYRAVRVIRTCQTIAKDALALVG